MKIAIASGKGGTGKTTLAVNLALRAAETEATVLIDLDVEEPNSGLFLNGSPQKEERRFRKVPLWDKASCTLCGKCTEVCHYNAVLKLGDRILVLPELCHSCYACSELCPTKALPMQDTELGWLRVYHQGGLSFIESKLDIGVEMASPLINQTIAYVAQHFPDAGMQLRDCPPGTSCSVINATKDADLVILVTEPTPFGMHDLSLAVDTMRHLDKPLAVVINRVGIGCPVISSLSGADYVLLVTEPTISGLSDLQRVWQLTAQFQIPAGCIINKADLNIQVRDRIRDYLAQNGIKLIDELPYDEDFSQAITNGQSLVEYAPEKWQQRFEKIWSELTRETT